jgi:hypothetical protein
MRRYGIEGLLATPFAQASGMRRKLLRFAPEIAAAAVWANLLPAWLILREFSSQPLVSAAAWCILLGGLVLVTVPAALAAQSFSAERDRDTLDALLLTRVNRPRLVWGRYWGIVLPWLRFVLWTLPLLVLWMESTPQATGWCWCNAMEVMGAKSRQLCALGSRPLLGLFWYLYGEHVHGDYGDMAVVSGLRFLFDALDLLLVTAIGLYLSVRLRSATAATAAALIVSLAVCGALGAADWECLMDQRIGLWANVWFLLKAGEVLLAVNLVRLAAGNFERHALEKSDP